MYLGPTEIYASQLGAYPAPKDFGQLIRIVDLPQKPLFQWSGTMWLPLGGHVTLFQSAAIVTAPLDGLDNVLVNALVPGGLLGPNGRIEIEAAFAYTNSANNKTLRVRYSGAAGAIYYAAVVTTTDTLKLRQWIANRGSAASQHGGTSDLGVYGASGNAYQVSAVDTSLDSAISITALKVTGAEAVTLQSLAVRAYPAP